VLIRNRITELIYEVINPLLRDARIPYSVSCYKWTQEAAQKSPNGHTNELFLQKLRESDVVLVILLSQLRKGTYEEIQAALSLTEVELAILQFGNIKGVGSRKVKQFLRDNEEDIFYHPSDDKDSDLAWQGILRVLLRLTFGSIEQLRRDHPEVYADDL
jgi:hypothetical protein